MRRTNREEYTILIVLSSCLGFRALHFHPPIVPESWHSRSRAQVSTTRIEIMQRSMSDIDVGFISRRAIHLRNLRESARKAKGAAGSHTSLEAYARKEQSWKVRSASDRTIRTFQIGVRSKFMQIFQNVLVVSYLFSFFVFIFCTSDFRTKIRQICKNSAISSNDSANLSKH